MSANIGNVDRAIRMVVGLALLVAAYEALTGVWMWLALAVGTVLTVTAIVGMCPAYNALGVNTCRGKLKGV